MSRQGTVAGTINGGRVLWSLSHKFHAPGNYWGWLHELRVAWLSFMLQQFTYPYCNRSTAHTVASMVLVRLYSHSSMS